MIGDDYWENLPREEFIQNLRREVARARARGDERHAKYLEDELTNGYVDYMETRGAFNDIELPSPEEEERRYRRAVAYAKKNGYYIPSHPNTYGSREEREKEALRQLREREKEERQRLIWAEERRIAEEESRLRDEASMRDLRERAERLRAAAKAAVDEKYGPTKYLDTDSPYYSASSSASGSGGLEGDTDDVFYKMPLKEDTRDEAWVDEKIRKLTADGKKEILREEARKTFAPMKEGVVSSEEERRRSFEEDDAYRRKMAEKASKAKYGMVISCEAGKWGVDLPKLPEGVKVPWADLGLERLEAASFEEAEKIAESVLDVLKKMGIKIADDEYSDAPRKIKRTTTKTVHSGGWRGADRLGAVYLVENNNVRKDETQAQEQENSVWNKVLDGMSDEEFDSVNEAEAISELYTMMEGGVTEATDFAKMFSDSLKSKGLDAESILARSGVDAEALKDLMATKEGVRSSLETFPEKTPTKKRPPVARTRTATKRVRDEDNDDETPIIAKSDTIEPKEASEPKPRSSTRRVRETGETPVRRTRFGIHIEEKPMSVEEQIGFYVENGMSFMLHGASGVGKTARVEAIDPNLTAVPLWNGVLPEDVVGKVRYPDGSVSLPPDLLALMTPEDAEQARYLAEENASSGEWVAPDWYTELCRKCAAEPERKHVVFFDEVTNAKPTTQSLAFHIVLKHSITPSKGILPQNAVVVLAGNSKEESGAAYNMPEPLFRRMCGHVQLKANVADWITWGSQRSHKHPERTNIHPLVASFVGTYGNDVFYTPYDEETPPKFALDPRSWEQVSDIVYENKGVLRRELLVNKMGSELSKSFIAFAKHPPLTVKDVVEDNYTTSDIPKTYEAKLALTLGMRFATERQVEKVRNFVDKYLGAENRAIFDDLWCDNNKERMLRIARLSGKGGGR